MEYDSALSILWGCVNYFCIPTDIVAIALQVYIAIYVVSESDHALGQDL